MTPKIKRMEKSSLLFNADGSLTIDGLEACEVMQVDPEALKLKNE